MQTKRLRGAMACLGAGFLALLPALPASPASAATITAPPVNGQFDYQIGGAYPPKATVAIVDRDRGSTPVAGKYNVCYLNAFQTQPAETTWWKANHSNLLLKNSRGGYVSDPDWPGEILLDTSTAAKRSGIATVEYLWIDGCRSAGFNAVEPDNLDSYSRSGARLTKAHNMALAALLASRSHADGLAFAQKNDTDVTGKDKSAVGFDFAIAEECQVYSECGAYTALYGNHVIEIEYTDNARSAYTNACSARGAAISIILRDRNVVPARDSAYHYEYC